MKLNNIYMAFLNGIVYSRKNSILTPAMLIFLLIMSYPAFTQQPDTLFSLTPPFEEIDGLFGSSVSGIGDINQIINNDLDKGTLDVSLSGEGFVQQVLDDIHAEIPDSLQAVAGDTVDVPIFLTLGNNRLSAFGAAIKATNGILSYTGFTQGPIVPGAILNVNDITPDSLRLGFFDAGGGPITEDGLLATLHFLVDSNAVVGDTSSLIFSELSAADSLGNPIAVNADNGKVTVTTAVGISMEPGQIPRQFALEDNFPNPFNPATTIRYQLSETARVSLAIFNALGQRVRTLVHSVQQPPGYYQLQWDGHNDGGIKAASGLYFYRIEIKAASQVFAQTRKMVMLQ